MIRVILLQSSLYRSTFFVFLSFFSMSNRRGNWRQCNIFLLVSRQFTIFSLARHSLLVCFAVSSFYYYFSMRNFVTIFISNYLFMCIKVMYLNAMDGGNLLYHWQYDKEKSVHRTIYWRSLAAVVNWMKTSDAKQKVCEREKERKKNVQLQHDRRERRENEFHTNLFTSFSISFSQRIFNVSFFFFSCHRRRREKKNDSMIWLKSRQYTSGVRSHAHTYTHTLAACRSIAENKIDFLLCWFWFSIRNRYETTLTDQSKCYVANNWKTTTTTDEN